MKVSIDRFEGEYAVCEQADGNMIRIKKKSLPPEAKEGNILRIGDSIVVDQEESREKEKQMEELTRDLWK